MAQHAFSVKVTGATELERKLQDIQKGLRRRWVRGAVAEGANVIRDQVQDNALKLGFGRAYEYPTSPGGRVIDHRGLLPFAVHAWVERSQKVNSATGRVAMAQSPPRGPEQTFHWYFVEFGSIHNYPPRPFFTPAPRQASKRAMKAAHAVFTKQLARMNKLR